MWQHKWLCTPGTLGSVVLGQWTDMVAVVECSFQASGSTEEQGREMYHSQSKKPPEFSSPQMAYLEFCQWGAETYGEVEPLAWWQLWGVDAPANTLAGRRIGLFPSWEFPSKNNFLKMSKCLKHFLVVIFGCNLVNEKKTEANIIEGCIQFYLLT